MRDSFLCVHSLEIWWFAICVWLITKAFQKFGTTAVFLYKQFDFCKPPCKKIIQKQQQQHQKNVCSFVRSLTRNEANGVSLNIKYTIQWYSFKMSVCAHVSVCSCECAFEAFSRFDGWESILSLALEIRNRPRRNSF